MTCYFRQRQGGRRLSSQNVGLYHWNHDFVCFNLNLQVFPPADCSRILQRAFKNLKWRYESVVERKRLPYIRINDGFKSASIGQERNGQERAKATRGMQKRESTTEWFSYPHLPLFATACRAECSDPFAPKLWIDESA